MGAGWGCNTRAHTRLRRTERKFPDRGIADDAEGALLFCVPRTIKTICSKAGLLTCPYLRAAFPTPRRGQWHAMARRRWVDSQQRVCSGFSPDSLFIGLWRAERPRTDTVEASKLGGKVSKTFPPTNNFPIFLSCGCLISPAGRLYGLSVRSRKSDSLLFS